MFGMRTAFFNTITYERGGVEGLRLGAGRELGKSFLYSTSGRVDVDGHLTAPTTATTTSTASPAATTPAHGGHTCLDFLLGGVVDEKVVQVDVVGLKQIGEGRP
jgi:hypothetical protein